MRITKKFAGASCIGKQVFVPNDDAHSEDLTACEEGLQVLEDLFHTRLLGSGSNKRPPGSPAGEAAAAGTVQQQGVGSRSSGRERSRPHYNVGGSGYNSYNYKYDGSSGYDDSGYDDGAAAKSILSSTSEWLLSSASPSRKGRSHNNKNIPRVMSAPNLALTHMHSDYIIDNSNRQSNNDMNRMAYGEEHYRTDYDYSKVLENNKSDYRRGAANDSAIRGKNPMKRVMSQVSLHEYATSSQEDRAASDLLMQFVTKVKQDACASSPSTVSESPRAFKAIKTRHNTSSEDDNNNGPRSLSPFSSYDNDNNSGGGSLNEGSGGEGSGSDSSNTTHDANRSVGEFSEHGHVKKESFDGEGDEHVHFVRQRTLSARSADGSEVGLSLTVSE
jgi:hypothetical protein